MGSILGHPALLLRLAATPANVVGETEAVRFAGLESPPVLFNSPVQTADDPQGGPAVPVCSGETPVNTQGRWYSLMAFTMLP
jgi:hypothetical protein